MLYCVCIEAKLHSDSDPDIAFSLYSSSFIPLELISSFWSSTPVSYFYTCVLLSLVPRPHGKASGLGTLQIVLPLTRFIHCYVHDVCIAQISLRNRIIKIANYVPRPPFSVWSGHKTTSSLDSSRISSATVKKCFFNSVKCASSILVGINFPHQRPDTRQLSGLSTCVLRIAKKHKVACPIHLPPPPPPTHTHTHTQLHC